MVNSGFCDPPRPAASYQTNNSRCRARTLLPSPCPTKTQSLYIYTAVLTASIPPRGKMAMSLGEPRRAKNSSDG